MTKSAAEVAPSTASRRSWLATLERPGDRAGWIRLLVGLALMCLTLIQLGRVVAFDYRDGPLVGDQASHLLQTLSIVEQGNLSYDVGDIEAWDEVGWASAPRGLFYQHNGDGYAFAKPYGYSVWMSPFVFVAGPVRGVVLANAGLLVALLAISYAIVRHRFDPMLSGIVAVVFVFGSSAYPFAYVIHPDVFLATLSALIGLLALRLDRSTSLPVAIALGVTTGFAISEKPTLLAVYAFVIGAVLWRSRSARLAAIVGGSFVGSLALSVMPYLYYSDFGSWNPYSGDRFSAPRGDVPFDSTPLVVGGGPTGSERYFSVSYWTDTIGQEGAEIVQSAGYAFVGRHTGMLPFMPLAFLVLAAVLVRRRSEWNLQGAAVLLGLGAYLGFYVTLFPFNYFGGGQTIGNRYLLQVIPVLLLVLVYLPLRRRLLLSLAGAAAFLSLLFLGPHHRDPDRAFWLLARISVTQELLPFEYGRTDDKVFACGTYELDTIVRHGSDLCHEVFGVQVERVQVTP